MAATVPQVDMTMIGRVLASAQKTKARAADQHRQRLASLVSRTQTGPVPTLGLIWRENEADDELLDRWAEIVGALPRHLQEVINLDGEGLDMPEIAEELSVPLVTVWDRALEATAAILEAAGLPVVNRWLEAKLKEFDLYPAKAAPFPGDIGWVIRHLPRRMREGTYARISCRGVDIPAVWGMKVPTYHNRWSAAKRALHLYGIACRALPASAPYDYFPDFCIADKLDVGWVTVLRAARSLGIAHGPYPRDTVPAIWRAIVGTPEYLAQL